VYFFGFFGISFLDKNSMSRFPSSSNLNDYAKEGSNDVRGRETPNLAPLHDTPICAEKAYRAPVHHPHPLPVPAPHVLTGAELEAMSDDQVLGCLANGMLKDHELEKRLKDCER